MMAATEKFSKTRPTGKSLGRGERGGVPAPFSILSFHVSDPFHGWSALCGSKELDHLNAMCLADRFIPSLSKCSIQLFRILVNQVITGGGFDDAPNIAVDVPGTLAPDTDIAQANPTLLIHIADSERVDGSLGLDLTGIRPKNPRCCVVTRLPLGRDMKTAAVQTTASAGHVPAIVRSLNHCKEPARLD